MREDEDEEEEPTQREEAREKFLTESQRAVRERD